MQENQCNLMRKQGEKKEVLSPLVISVCHSSRSTYLYINYYRPMLVSKMYHYTA
jgi:hypothetical protein